MREWRRRHPRGSRWSTNATSRSRVLAPGTWVQRSFAAGWSRRSCTWLQLLAQTEAVHPGCARDDDEKLRSELGSSMRELCCCSSSMNSNAAPGMARRLRSKRYSEAKSNRLSSNFASRPSLLLRTKSTAKRREGVAAAAADDAGAPRPRCVRAQPAGQADVRQAGPLLQDHSAQPHLQDACARQRRCVFAVGEASREGTRE